MTVEWLQGLNFPTLGAGALVSAFVIAIYTGRLIPKSTVDAQLAIKDQQLADQLATKNEQIAQWKGVAADDKETAKQAMDQVDALLGTVSTMEAVLRALPSPSTRPPGADPDGS